MKQIDLQVFGLALSAVLYIYLIEMNNIMDKFFFEMIKNCEL